MARLDTAQIEARGARKVVVLGATVAEALFGEESAVGQEIRIRATPFEVIGVLARKGQNPRWGRTRTTWRRSRSGRRGGA